jgi:rhodanese-related sulfurtransferase
LPAPGNRRGAQRQDAAIAAGLHDAMASNAKGILYEALAVAGAGLLCALSANFLSPRGLSLTRDYFPKSAGQPSRPRTAAATSSEASTDAIARPLSPGVKPAPPAAPDTAWARLQEKGLQPLGGREALQSYQDPMRAQDLIVFVDARDDAHYQAGHIPGAYQFDRYYPDKYLPGVLPACANALKIVVYCNGGACEDSEFAALTLREAGMAAGKVFVFVGGITEWTTNGWPVETGVRNSGVVKGRTP